MIQVDLLTLALALLLPARVFNSVLVIVLRALAGAPKSRKLENPGQSPALGGDPDGVEEGRQHRECLPPLSSPVRSRGQINKRSTVGLALALGNRLTHVFCFCFARVVLNHCAPLPTAAAGGPVRQAEARHEAAAGVPAEPRLPDRAGHAAAGRGGGERGLHQRAGERWTPKNALEAPAFLPL